MARPACDIACPEQLLLFEFGVKVGLHADIGVLNAPKHELSYGGGGAVSVKYFQPVPLHDKLIAHRSKRTRSLGRQQCARLLVAVNPFADKVIGRVVAYLLNDIRDKFSQHHKPRRILGNIVVKSFQSHAKHLF